MLDAQGISICRRLLVKPVYRQFLTLLIAAVAFGNAPAGAALQEKNSEPLEQIPQERLQKTPKGPQRDFNLIPLSDLPDLVSSVHAGTTHISHGDEVELQIELKNVGDAPADFSLDSEKSSDVVILRILRFAPQESLGDILDDDGAAAREAETLAAVSAPSLIDPGESVRVRHTLNVQDDFVVGIHEICAVSDPEDVVREKNEGNNRKCLQLYLRTRPVESITGATKQKLDTLSEKFPGPQIPDRKRAIEPEPEPEEEE